MVISSELYNQNGRVNEGSIVEFLKGCIGIGKNMPEWGKTSEGDKTKNNLVEYVKDILEKDKENDGNTSINVEVIDPKNDEEENE